MLHIIYIYTPGPGWLKNLYFAYLLVLRAVTKAEGYWQQHRFYTGSKQEDLAARERVKEIVQAAKYVYVFALGLCCNMIFGPYTRCDVANCTHTLYIFLTGLLSIFSLRNFYRSLLPFRGCSSLFDETTMFAGNTSAQLKVMLYAR